MGYRNRFDEPEESEEEMQEKASRVTVMKIHAHSVDRNHFRFVDAHGKTVFDKEGYVPLGLGIGGGDDVELDIDIKTGQILNWKEITTDDLVDIQRDE